MAKTQRYYLNFALQFGDTNDLKKVLNVTKRLIPRLQGLITNRLANTELVRIAQRGMDHFRIGNLLRNGPRTKSISDNFGASKQVNRDASHFFIYHKFLDKDEQFSYTTPGKKTFMTSAKTIINFLAYGRKGYRIPRTMPGSNDQVNLCWQYGRGSKFHFRRIPPSKQIKVPGRKGWVGGGLFKWVDEAVGNYVSAVRNEIAAIIKAEGAIPK